MDDRRSNGGTAGAFRPTRFDLPEVEKPVEETLLGGYYRIGHTDDLIEDALRAARTPEDRRFWADARREERGHAELYRADLLALWGRSQLGEWLAAYQPCPEIVELLAWCRQASLHLACYRAYLENYLVQMPDAPRREFTRLLPRTARVHFAADPHHAKDCARYLARFAARDVQRCFGIVERALSAEARWRGLPDGELPA